MTALERTVIAWTKARLEYTAYVMGGPSSNPEALQADLDREEAALIRCGVGLTTDTGLTLQQVIEALTSYRDRHGVPPETPVRFELSPEHTVEIDGISSINNTIVLTSLDTEWEGK